MRVAARPLLVLAVLVTAALAWAQPALAAPPTATALPEISGTAREGQTLKTTNGSWSGTTPMSFAYRWLRCDAAGSGCVGITGATSSSYVLTAADVGATLRVTVTAENVDGAASETSGRSAEIAPKAPPVNTVLPVVTGTAVDGQTLTVDNGTWTGTATISYARKWLRCDATGGTCTVLSATGTSYKLTGADIGFTMRVQVTATNPDGSAIVVTGATAVVDAAPPVNTLLPSTGGTAREGQTLNVSNVGSWQGTTPMSYSFQWERCAADGTACLAVAGATAKTYVLVAADVGATMRVRVTATNVKASASAWSATTVVIAPKAPPLNTALPTISGTPMDGQALTGSAGTWTGTATISYAYRWLRCDAAGAGCVELSATSANYTATASDVGATLRLRVTATNPDGTTVAVSDATAVVAPAPPVSTAAPAISGTTREGQLLSATAGSWKGTPTITYAYQWHRCDAAGVCTAITGATNATYRLVAADVGGIVRVSVVASNAAGSATAWSALTATITAGPPVSVAAPQVSGPLARDGETWTGSLGDWAGTATIVLSRQWLRCSSTGTSCAAITGEIASTYGLGGADVGKTVRLEVTAANSQGTVKALSPPSPVIAPAPPVADGAPVISGELRDTVQLTALSSWSGTAPITLSYAWERCDPLSDVCQDILAATASTYTLTPADVGFRVRVRVGAVNAAGGGTATSAISAIVQRDPPRAIGAPVLSGSAVELDTLTVSLGTFSGTPQLTYAVQWQRCDDTGAACADITGATGASRVLDAADRGKTLRARVTATNGAGSASAVSAVSAVVAPAPPRNTVAPAVSPETGLKDGVTVTATGGGWTGSDPLELSWRWQRCSSTGTSCEDIPGASGQSYTVVTADVGWYLRAVVTATTPGGQASQASPVTGVVGTNPPVNVVAPAVTGPAADGEQLRADDGSWTGLVPFVTTYRWFRCDAAGTNCGVVTGATDAAYRLSSADVGFTLVVEVMQTNTGGSTAMRSAPSGVVAASPPGSVVAPRILGAAGVGRTLTADVGVWSGTPELAFEYVWLRCDAAGAACAPIDGATASTYRIGAADDDATLRVRVTARNAVGVATAESSSTAEVQSEPPVNVVAPEIEAAGLVAAGTLLQARAGTWAGATPMQMTYRWRRCDATLGGCVDIPSAVGESYRLTKEDIGSRVLVVVTAENVVDVGTAQSPTTPAVLVEPPSNVTAPVVKLTGAVRDGAKLTAGLGTWKGATPLSYTTRWLRCDASGDGCAAIAGAVGPSYTLSADDVGARIRARVVAANAATEVTADSAATSAVAAALPSSTTRPAIVVIDGKPQVGGRVRAVTGAWTGTSPLDIGVRWQRCAGTSLAGCEDIPGATGAEYVPTEADIGRRLRLAVTVANAAGTVTAESTPTTAVPAVAPDSLDAPAVTGGPARDGVELRADPGRWTGTAPLTFAYAWERCTTPGGPTCPKIAGATRPTYTPTSTDVGKYVRVTVTAMNAGGKAARSSAATDEVAALAPSVVDAPTATIRGDVKVGATLSATSGRFAGSTPMTTRLRWQRCDARGAGCTDVPGGTKPTYTLKADDVAGALLSSPMRVVVTATNVAGTTEAPSALVGRVVATREPGAAGDREAGVARPKRRGTRARRKAKVAATVRRVAFGAGGSVLVTLACPRKARGSCGAAGSVVAGGIRRTLATNAMRRGTAFVKRLPALSPAERASLAGKRSVRFVVRTGAPSTPKRVRVRRMKAAVPARLRRGPGRRAG